MSSQPLVTILITAYNTRPSYLNEAVESAVNQDYPNLEVLLVDDGSKPRLDSLLNKKDHPRLRFDYMEHRGVPHGLIRGVEGSRGEYIAILDHDDVLTEGSIRSRVERMEREKVGLVYGDVEQIDKEGKVHCSTRFKTYSDVSDFVRAVLASPFFPLAHSGAMFNKEVVVKVGNYDRNLNSVFDNDLHIRVAREAGISHLPEIVARYRTHENNLTLSVDYRMKGLKNSILLIDKYVDTPLDRFYLKNKITLITLAKILLRNKKLTFQKYRDVFELSNYNPFHDMFYVMNGLGKDFKPINIYKFRSMYPDSNGKLEDLLKSGVGIDQHGKYIGDPRVTRTGKFLRKHWIDELPQFLNLVKGDIKLVGVRPKGEKEWSLYPEDVKKKVLKYKPGLFGVHYAFRERGGIDLHVKIIQQYLEGYKKNPIGTETRYLIKILSNILFRGVRSS